MKTLTVTEVVLAFITVGVILALGRLAGIRAPKNAPAPRPKPLPPPPEDLGELIVCGEWPINPGDRVRLLVSVPEYGTEIGQAATCEAVWPGDDVQYRFKLDGRRGRDAIITFLDSELWQLERIQS